MIYCRMHYGLHGVGKVNKKLTKSFESILHNAAYLAEDAAKFDKCFQILFTLYNPLSTLSSWAELTLE